jgi:dTDP-glucose 4,6-dehydratase
VIPTIITQIANGAKSIKLGSLSPTRDFSFVKDTVLGFASALESNTGLGEVVNLGSGFEISIGDTAKLISELIGSESKITLDEDRIRPIGSEVERLFASNAKAKDLFGWEPTYAGLVGFKKGLAETINWFSQPENLVSYKSELYNV